MNVENAFKAGRKTGRNTATAMSQYPLSQARLFNAWHDGFVMGRFDAWRVAQVSKGIVRS